MGELVSFIGVVVKVMTKIWAVKTFFRVCVCVFVFVICTGNQSDLMISNNVSMTTNKQREVLLRRLCQSGNKK